VSANVSEVLRLLREEYGERRWQPHRDPVSTLVATILSQNTSDANSSRAFHTLMAAFGGCESVAAAPGRITLVLQEIQRERGSLDLDFLKEMPLAEARSWLMQLPGVGPKTASCVVACCCSHWGDRPCRWIRMSCEYPGDWD